MILMSMVLGLEGGQLDINVHGFGIASPFRCDEDRCPHTLGHIVNL